MASVPDFDLVHRNLQQRLGCCLALRELSHAQNQHIAGAHYTELVDVLTHKQELVDALQRLDEEIPQLAERWKQWRGTLAESRRAPIEETVAQVEAALAELLQIEQSGTQQLEQQIAETQRELRQLQQQSLQRSRPGGRDHDARPQLVDIRE